MPKYLIIKPDGSWGYTSEKPKSGPIVTEEEADAYIATRGFSLNPEMGQRQLAEERGLTTATAPEPMAGPNITGLDPDRFGATSRLPEEFQAPQNYSNLYSPADQRKIEELERERSEITMDPTLDEDVRQITLDEVHVQLSRIPKLSPMMREPTAEEKFGQRIVEVIKGPIREYYYFDDKNNPHLLESSEEKLARDEAYLKTYNKNIDNFTKLNEKNDLELTTKHIVEMSKYIADITHRPEERGAPPGQQGPGVRTMRGPVIEDYYFDKSGKPISLTELKKIYKVKREHWETLFDSVIKSLMIANEQAGIGEELTFEEFNEIMGEGNELTPEQFNEMMPKPRKEMTPKEMADLAESMTDEIVEQGGKMPKTKVKKDILNMTDEELRAIIRGE